jgi:mRNA interferase RelE/StbE
MRDIIAMKTVVLTHQAAKDLDALPEDNRTAIAKGLFAYAISGVGDVKRLQGSPFFRLRIGRFRVIFEEDQTTVFAIYVGKRETTTYRRV